MRFTRQTFRRKLAAAALAAATASAGVAALPGAALAGDANRYVDRADWPDWAVQRPREPRWVILGGEMFDAAAFELIRGYPVTPVDQYRYYDREFRFFNPVTRAEFAAMLSRALALAQDGAGAAWYVPHVEALQARGVIPPDPTGAAGTAGSAAADAAGAWSTPIRRREAGRWMGRAADAFKADADRDTRTFSDVDDPLILRAVRAGIVKGTGAGRFEPDKILIRGEAAVMLLRLARAMNSEGNDKKTEVFRQLTEIIKKLDSIASLESQNRVRTGKLSLLTEIDPAAGEMATEEMLRYGKHQTEMTLWQANPDHTQWTWAENIDSAYKFEPVEIHDNIAIVKVADAAGNVYRGEGRGNPVKLNAHYGGLQFFVKRDGKWLLSGAK